MSFVHKKSYGAIRWDLKPRTSFYSSSPLWRHPFHSSRRAFCPHTDHERRPRPIRGVHCERFPRRYSAQILLPTCQQAFIVGFYLLAMHLLLIVPPVAQVLHIYQLTSHHHSKLVSRMMKSPKATIHWYRVYSAALSARASGMWPWTRRSRAPPTPCGRSPPTSRARAAQGRGGDGETLWGEAACVALATSPHKHSPNHKLLAALECIKVKGRSRGRSLHFFPPWDWLSYTIQRRTTGIGLAADI